MFQRAPQYLSHNSISQALAILQLLMDDICKEKLLMHENGIDNLMEVTENF